jgi:DNA-binding CsgD family transcriptional regulator
MEMFEMPALRSDPPRRVGLVARPPGADEAGRDGTGPPLHGTDGLMTIADALVRAIRDGTFQTDPEEGILLDLTVGRVRCLLLEQQESVTVALSPREQQIALMVASGRTNQSIAASLEISAWTVSTHLRRIYAKLAVSSRAEMVAHLLSHADYAYLVDPTRPH